MTRIEAIIRLQRLGAVKAALASIGVTDFAVSELGESGAETSAGEPQMSKVEIITADDAIEAIVESIIGAARTGEIGDGKIFTFPIEDAVEADVVVRWRPPVGANPQT